MGTNYYVEVERCKHCGHQPERLHIGKSSAGWCFSLRVIPELSLNTWEDWLAYLQDKKIVSEYGELFSVVELQDVVEVRGVRNESWERDWWAYGNYKSEEDFHRANCSKRGPNGLLRHKVDGDFCISNGEGTWDYVKGDFS